MLKEKIEKAIEKKVMKHNLSGNEGVSVTLTLTDAEKKEFVETDLNEKYEWWEFDNEGKLTVRIDDLDKPGDMRVWKRNGYTVEEKEFDYDLHQFDIVKDNKVIATITPNSIKDMQSVIEDLNEGVDVDGWEDGNGNTIIIPNNEINEIE